MRGNLTVAKIPERLDRSTSNNSGLANEKPPRKRQGRKPLLSIAATD